MSDVHGFFGEQVEAVKAASNLVDLVGETTAVRKDGSGFVALCPFHQERSPSLGIFDKGEGWRFYCHGCKVSGDVIKYVELRDGLTFREAVESLAGKVGITLKSVAGDQPRGPSRTQQKGAMAAAVAFYADQLASPYGADARAYLAGRGFAAETISAWQMGWAPGKGLLTRHLVKLGFTAAEIAAADLGDDRGDRFYDRVMIPITDIMGHPIALAGRLLPDAIKALEARGTKAAKYINTKETDLYSKGSVLFGLAKAKASMRELRLVTVVEGQLDVIAAHQLGQTNTVATCGTSLTAAHVERLRHLLDDGRVVVQFDGDKAGQVNTVAALSQLWQVGMRTSVAVLQGVKDLGEALPAGVLPERVEQPGDRWLIQHVIPKRAEDELDRLPQADAVLAIIKHHADADWRGLVAERLAAHLGFAGSRIKSRLKVALGGVPDPETPETPGKPAAGAGDEGDNTVRDGGHHDRVVAMLLRFLRDEGVAPDAVGGWLKADSDVRVSVTLKILSSRFYFRYAPRFQSLSPERVLLILNSLVEDGRRARRAAILAPIIGASADPAGVAELGRWVRAVTGRDDATDLAVMLHFVWQVKRRSSDLRVSHDLMPIITGIQGDGKSVAVEKLCAPLLELTRQVNADALTDDRHKLGLADYHIGIWDELQGGSRADVNALKHIITANTVTYRELASHTIVVLPKRITLIATTNESVADIITDTTGARRFYQLTSQNPCDWDTINEIDYPLIWRAVHQEDPPPFDDQVLSIRTRQQDLIHIDGVRTWLQGETFCEMTLVESDRPYGDASSPANHVYIPALKSGRGEICDHLVRRFQRWARLSGAQPVAPNKLGGRLKSLGWIRRRDDAAPRAWRYHPPSVIPKDWAIAPPEIADEPRQPKSPDQRAASNADAAAGFGAGYSSGLADLDDAAPLQQEIDHDFPSA